MSHKKKESTVKSSNICNKKLLDAILDLRFFFKKITLVWSRISYK